MEGKVAQPIKDEMSPEAKAYLALHGEATRRLLGAIDREALATVEGLYKELPEPGKDE